ncbi:MAG: DUF3500 domain-containing protein [Bryobacteraceae bacterium]|nr:DUF3500 domain-containing protein [Bryobacteraceae bacterium]
MCLNSHVKQAHASRLSRRGLLSTVIPAGMFAAGAAAQQPAQTPAAMMERFRQMSKDAEAKGLAQAFKGLTTNGTVEPDLFAVKKTGVSTAGVRSAAERFVESLNPAQRSRAMFTVDDPEWRKWMNQHFYRRQGVGFDEMDGRQRDAAFALVRSGLSARGFDLARNIMRLNETLAELTNDHVGLGEWLYYITIMGKPSATEPWGWQLDGHHCIVNYFVLGDQVVMTPHFFGSEPVKATSGKYKGTTILQEEQNRGLEMLTTLGEPLRKKAVLEFSKTGNNNLTEAFKDNVVLDYAGARVADMAAAEKKRLVELVDLYVANMDEGHARVKMDEVRKHLDRTAFAWIGASDAESVFYYRIHSPVILIEFDHQTPANLRNLPGAKRTPDREHIHCVVRTPNGNDYGKDLLRQHYLSHKHA